MKKTKLIVIALSLLMGISALLAQNLAVRAQLLEIGVFPNDYFMYGRADRKEPWVTMSPSNAPLPAGWKSLMNTSTMTYNVLNIQAPRAINFNRTVTYQNGTTTPSRGGWVDIVSGDGPGALVFIRAGLSRGDLIYPENANFTWAINSTFVDRTHWNGRELCVLNFTITAPPINGSLASLVVRRSVIWWDRLTGALVSAFEEVAAYNKETQVYFEGRLLYQLIATNRFSAEFSGPPDLTPIYAIAGVSITIAFVVAVIRFARNTPKKEHKRLKTR